LSFCYCFTKRLTPCPLFLFFYSFPLCTPFRPVHSLSPPVPLCTFFLLGFVSFFCGKLWSCCHKVPTQLLLTLSPPFLPAAPKVAFHQCVRPSCSVSPVPSPSEIFFSVFAPFPRSLPALVEFHQVKSCRLALFLFNHMNKTFFPPNPLRFFPPFC